MCLSGCVVALKCLRLKMRRSRIQFVSILIIIAFMLIPNAYGNGHSESGEIFYGTFFGGSGEDGIRDVKLDSEGNIIVVGGTFSEDFPTLNAVQENYGGGELASGENFHLLGDAFVAKFSPDYELLWSTYIGGSDFECAYHVEIGGDDEVIVVGSTTSTDFPVTLDSTPSGRERGDSFIVMYSPDGDLIGARLYLPDEIDEILHVEMDSLGNLVLGGMTSSEMMFTTEDAFQRELAGGTDGFIRVVTYDLETVVYSTYFGGSGDEFLGEVAVGQDDSIYIAGGSSSRDLPVTQNCLRSEFVGDETDNFIAKICPSRNLVTCTYFGGSGVDHVFGLSEGPDDSIVVVGRTWSDDYPVTDDALQPEYSDIEVDGFLTKISRAGDELLYSTYYGGESWDSLLQVNMDETGRLIISGFVLTGEFETLNAFQSEYKGSSDIVIIIMDEEIEMISYLGGYYEDHPFEQVVQDGVLYLVGGTTSPRFGVSENAYQGSIGGDRDGYLFVMDYEEYLSSEHSTEDGSAGSIWYEYRDYISYGVVLGVIVVWYLYMRRTFSGEG